MRKRLFFPIQYKLFKAVYSPQAVNKMTIVSYLRAHIVQLFNYCLFGGCEMVSPKALIGIFLTTDEASFYMVSSSVW